MYSIYPQYFSSNLVYNFSGLPAIDQKEVLKFLALAKFFATNASLALKEFHRGNIKGFDPLVRDRCCQVHAMQVLEIFKDEKVRQEVCQLQETVKKILQLINQKMNKHPVLEDQTPFESFVKKENLLVEISRKVKFLFFAHLLTVCTSKQHPRQILYAELREKLSKFLDIDLVKQSVSIARTILSENSILFIQGAAKNLILEDSAILQSRLAIVRHFDIKHIDGNCGLNFPTELTATCMFYNTKAVLLLAREKQILILLKEFRKDKQKPAGLFFRSEAPGKDFIPISEEKVNPKETVLVFDVEFLLDFTKEQLLKTIDREKLSEIVLKEVTLINQFAADNDLSELDLKAQHEISIYKEKQQTEKRLFSILHIYSSSVGSEGVL